MIGEILQNLKRAQLTSLQADALVAKLMELMTRWNVEAIGHNEDKGEGLVMSKFEEDFEECCSS